MTTIAIIGSGHVGSNLARAAITHGYDVVLSNSQGPQTLAGLVRELGPKASAATPAQAAAAGDFAIVAIPLATIGQVPVEPLAGKVVIATINYFPQRYGHVSEIDDGTTTAPGLLQAHLPASRVVRAFSMINAEEMSGDGHPQGDPRRRALALAGDLLAVAGNSLDLWAVEGGERLVTLEPDARAVNCLDLSPDGQTLVVGNDRKVSSRDLSQLREILTGLELGW